MMTRLAILLLAAFWAICAQAEKRCGWIQNPSPQNWTFNDADGEWLIMLQGGYQAEGMDKIGDISAGDYVRQNGLTYHGYGCGCMDVETDPAEKIIKRIDSFNQLPLTTCRADPALSEPRSE